MISDSKEALERKIQILTRLAEISATLNSTLKLKPLLSTIMDTAAEILDAEAASVLLWDTKANELRFAATTTQGSGQSLIGRPVPLEGSIAGLVLRENRIVTVDNATNDPRHYPKVDEDIDFHTRSLLGVPLTSKNRVIGVLEAVNKRELPWTADDGHYVSILAAQAAVAIEAAQLVAALQKANDELSQVDKLKSDFIAIASHELRTPLGVILGYASFLQEMTDNEISGHATKVVESALQLRRIIEDLTNLRYLEQTQGELHREPLALDDLLRDVIREAVSLAEAKGHQLDYLAPPPGVHIIADRIRISMAISNLLNNAIRFTPDSGHIVVKAEIHKRAEVWISVSDNGMGLPQDQINRIFDKFYQVEDHMTRRHGGLGIGLSIAKALVETHGGRIWATSAGLNRGASFTIALPLVQEITVIR